MRKYLSELKFADRKTVLQQSNKSTRNKLLPFVTQYHPVLLGLKEILWYSCQLFPSQIREVFFLSCPEFPNIAENVRRCSDDLFNDDISIVCCNFGLSVFSGTLNLIFVINRVREQFVRICESGVRNCF